jgi:hypothetical protein
LTKSPSNSLNIFSVTLIPACDIVEHVTVSSAGRPAEFPRYRSAFVQATTVAGLRVSHNCDAAPREGTA